MTPAAAANGTELPVPFAVDGPPAAAGSIPMEG